ncbi:MAG: pstS1 [Nitrososphaera sp.]|jgi:phosphate transport system substrate-binding protein|nr:pstS1 [Nitrososphaera sp.]
MNANLIYVMTAVLAGIMLLPHGTSIFAQVQPPSQLSQQQGQITINGAGATFPFPLIDTWRVEYQNVNPNVNINYQSIGSGGGIRQFTERTVDFGASDAPLSESDTQALQAPAVHIPETIGSVVAAYNINGVPEKGLKLTGPVLADIFRGVITTWNDPRIQELNPDLALPSENIVVAHRSDGSGTTFVWTSYLSDVSPEWNETVGSGTAVQWPVGIGAPGNEGVANTIISTPNSIGYIELAYALTTDTDYAYIQNMEGNFVEPSLNSTQTAVQAAVISDGGTSTNATTTVTGTQNTTSINLPAGGESWTDVSLLNAPGANSYPIASFSYLLLYQDLSTNIDSMERARALVDFVEWAITDGQQFADELSYVPLPDAVVQHNMQTLESLTFQGQPLLQQ